eukprot:1160915-Prorocentrum_minimum.AAC.2
MGSWWYRPRPPGSAHTHSRLAPAGQTAANLFFETGTDNALLLPGGLRGWCVGLADGGEPVLREGHGQRVPALRRAAEVWRGVPGAGGGQPAPAALPGGLHPLQGHVRQERRLRPQVRAGPGFPVGRPGFPAEPRSRAFDYGPTVDECRQSTTIYRATSSVSNIPPNIPGIYSAHGQLEERSTVDS